VTSAWLQVFILASIVARSKFTARQFLFPILVNVDRHRLGHQIAIQAHLEIKSAGMGISGLLVFGITVDALVINNLLVIEPRLDSPALVG
jgi:hypothetical protein